MNISSLRNIETDYASLYSVGNTRGPERTSDMAAAKSAGSIITSAYGDTFEFSGGVSGANSLNVIYGPPRGGAGGPGREGDPIQSFLDKVADGSVTEDDLQNMQATLQQMQQSGGADRPASPDGEGGFIRSFLDKVADGSVTSDDLKNMQTTLQQMQTQFAAGSSSTEKTGDAIKTFLDKVADGSVTEDDIKTMQTILNDMAQQSGNVGMHRHHHGHPSSGSDRTNPTGTSLDASSSGDNAGALIKSFLDKVADGSVTDDDLSGMQSMLQQIRQSSGSV